MNKNIYNENYNEYYQNNCACLYMYKSSRKNAKTGDFIWVYHLVPGVKVEDDRIINQFIAILDRLLYQSLVFNKHLEISYFSTIGKKIKYKNADNNMYHTTGYLRYNYTRRVFSSFEQLIIELYHVFSLVYPYNTISTRELFENKSIKYMINKYYERG